MKHDIAIIGNGTLALSTAYNLAKKNLKNKIVIVGNNNNDNASSINAGAMLAACSEVTKDTFLTKTGKTKFEITLQALKKWQAWTAELNKQLPANLKVSINKGLYLILNSISGKLDSHNYDAVIKTLEQHQEPYQQVSPEDIPGMYPIENCRATNAIFIPEEGNINPSSINEALVYILQSNQNISFINSDAEAINANKRILLNNKQTIVADKILISAGCGTTKLINSINELKYKTPMILPGVGYAISISQITDNPIKHVIRTTNRSGACGLHALPSDGNIYLGATNSVYNMPHKNAKIGLLQFVIQCGVQQINQKIYNSDIYSIKVGNRPASIDGFPLIGELPIKDIYVLSGTYREGFTQAPLLSDYISNLILDLPNNDYPKLNQIFQPCRPLIKTFSSIEQSINETVNHYIAGLHEHSMKLPSLMNEDVFRNMLYDKLLNIYQKLDTDFPLLPDMLFLFELNHSDEKTFAEYKQYFKNNKELTS